ncbi:helix-turn-helix domain-containing protein [Flagellimonas onchidii]|uniref:helix-turn-helix domain-containing protein n=1 Tax=Flagellimonas onchidii TaxID=2562684 RepID=UPI0010A5B990|nr:AraC family transcriptional regulator [Allomuricauda onchidii]
MYLKTSTDLVPLFKRLIRNLKPYANQQGVILSFRSKIKSLKDSYNPEEIIPQFSNVISSIISYTPQSYEVSISFDCSTENAVLKISNTGADLSRIREITNELNYSFNTKRIENGTIFKIEIPINTLNRTKTDDKDKNNLGYTPYYKEIENRLSNYFSDLKKMQNAADQKSAKSGLFLRRANTIIQTHMDDHNFKVSALASAMSLSRAQLYRKMKMLTNMSPSQYLLYFRLHVARELLETKGNGFNVSEAGYKVGFISKSHFTRSFQKQFGFIPSKVVNNMQR